MLAEANADIKDIRSSIEGTEARYVMEATDAAELMLEQHDFTDRQGSSPKSSGSANGSGAHPQWNISLIVGGLSTLSSAAPTT